MEKNLTKKQINTAKCLGLAPSMLNSIVTEKREIQEQIDGCRKSYKKRKPGGTLLSASLKVFQWFGTCKCGHQIFRLALFCPKLNVSSMQLTVIDFFVKE
jgi:hypothetical protein